MNLAKSLQIIYNKHIVMSEETGVRLEHSNRNVANWMRQNKLVGAIFSLALATGGLSVLVANMYEGHKLNVRQATHNQETCFELQTWALQHKTPIANGNFELAVGTPLYHSPYLYAGGNLGPTDYFNNAATFVQGRKVVHSPLWQNESGHDWIGFTMTSAAAGSVATHAACSNIYWTEVGQPSLDQPKSKLVQALGNFTIKDNGIIDPNGDIVNHSGLRIAYATDDKNS